MKTNSLLLNLVGALIVCGADAAAALPGPYVNVDLGSSFVEDVKIKVANTIATFDPGLAANLSFGYQFNNWLAAEFETGVLWNSIDKFAGSPLKAKGASADLYQIPFKLNLVVTVPTKSRWTPYFGGGGGVMAAVIDTHARPVPAPAVVSPLGNANFSDTDYTYVYQAMVGLKYDLSAHAQIDLGYKFFGTFDHNWSDRGYTLKTGAIYTHAVQLSFTWRF